MSFNRTAPLFALLATLGCMPNGSTDAGDALTDAGDTLADAGDVIDDDGDDDDSDGGNDENDAGGQAPGPAALLSPGACAFGDVEVGAAAFCELTLENPGDVDLVLSATAFSDDTPLATDDDGNFDTSLSGFGMQTFIFLPMFISPGTTTTFRLFVNPGAPGAMSGQWWFETNDPQLPRVEVALTATGVAP